MESESASARNVTRVGPSAMCGSRAVYDAAGLISGGTVPIFEYACRGCGREFEMLVRSGDVPACPGCASEDLEKLLSGVAIKSDSTHALALKAAKRRDAKRGSENARAQREYELSHND